MATFALILDKYVKKNGKQSVQLRVTIDRKALPKSTGFEVFAKDWDIKKERVKSSNKNYTALNDSLGRLLEDAERQYASKFATGKNPSTKEIIAATFATHNFYEFVQAKIDVMSGATQVRTKAKYGSWLEGMKEYSPTLTFEEITADFVNGYRDFLKKKGNKHNTITGRLSSFRAMVNAAPVSLRGSAFKETKVGTYRPAQHKVPLTATEITKLWNYQPRTPGEALTRDTFLFSYYAAGMRIGDVIQLRWYDIKDNCIVYYEGKKKHLGARNLYIPLNSYAAELIDRQQPTGTFIFGELKSKTPEQLVKEIDSREATMNNFLFKIAVHADIKKHITSKLARDTFADIANKRTQRNVYGISKAMGHTKIATTEIYLGEDQSAIDELLAIVYQG